MSVCAALVLLESLLIQLNIGMCNVGQHHKKLHLSLDNEDSQIIYIIAKDEDDKDKKTRNGIIQELKINLKNIVHIEILFVYYFTNIFHD